MGFLSFERRTSAKFVSGASATMVMGSCTSASVSSMKSTAERGSRDLLQKQFVRQTKKEILNINWALFPGVRNANDNNNQAKSCFEIVVRTQTVVGVG